MKNHWVALTALTLLAGACARGGEGDAGAALMDTTANSAELTGDTTVAAPAPAAVDGAPAADSAATGPTMDSTTAPAADAHGDSAAHP